MSQIPKPDPQTALRYFEQKMSCTAGPVELKHWREENAGMNIIDVRAREDYEKAHIPGALNLPKSEWESARGLSKDKTNIVYCYTQTCHLAASACLDFARKGFPVMEMEGGFEAWRKAGLETESESTAGKSRQAA